MWSKLWKLIEHNRFFVIALILCIPLFWVGACHPTAESPFSGEPVTQTELNAETEAYQIEVQGRIDAFFAELDAEVGQMQVGASAAHDDLERQAELRKQFYDGIIPFVPVEFQGLMPMLASLFGITAAGAVADNIRKNIVIKRVKNNS